MAQGFEQTRKSHQVWAREWEQNSVSSHCLVLHTCCTGPGDYDPQLQSNSNALSFGKASKPPERMLHVHATSTRPCIWWLSISHLYTPQAHPPRAMAQHLCSTSMASTRYIHSCCKSTLGRTHVCHPPTLIPPPHHSPPAKHPPEPHLVAARH